MKMRQIKPLIATRDEAETCLGEIATLTLHERDLKTAMDREITAAREKYETPLATVGDQIRSRQDQLMSWAGANPDVFAKKKSLEMMHGIIGFRTGKHKLKTLARRTWAIVLDTLKVSGKTDYVRISEEVNKEQIIADFLQSAVTNDDLKPLGVMVDQDEAFFVEVKLAELENRTAVLA